MFITKKHIPRRTFLRGAGVTLALPLLESMVPALRRLRLTAAAPPKRFVGIWHPHGASPGCWSPLQEGQDFEFSFITKPLESYRSRAVLIQLTSVKQDLGAGDKARIDPYVENIRELERRIHNAIENSLEEPSTDVPFGLPESKHVHFRLMYDLMALALEGDITRAITFMLGRDLSSATFPESGFVGAWHGTSHHGDKPENVANYAKENRYHVQNLAYFCEKLRNIPDGDGTLLDHVLIYKGSNMGNSHRHAHEKVPVILVGGIDGTFKGNRHLVFPDNTQRTSNMLLSILHLYGIDQDKIGTSTGPLQPLEMV